MARLAELDALLDMGGADKMGGYEGQDVREDDNRAGELEDQKEGEGSREDGAERTYSEDGPLAKGDEPPAKGDGPSTKGDEPPTKEDRSSIKEDRVPARKDRLLTREDLKKMRGQSMVRPAGWQGMVREKDCPR